MYADKFSSDYPEGVSSKYTVCRLIGRGACGEVRVVYERSTCLQFAMKIVSKKSFSTFNGANLNNRELTEVEILKKLDYPCIVRIHDVVESDDTLFIVLELVEGGELFDRVVASGNLSEEDTRFIFLQMLMATKYLHDNGITHRDLKPENILLSGNSNRCLIKVTDFGLSKIVNENTMLRTFCGTPTYLAPEVLTTAGSGSYTPAIDVWSLGVILYVCLVGYPPFTDERKDFDLKTQIIQGHYDFPDRFWRGVSEDAKDLIKRLMCVDPQKRITLEEALLHPWLNDISMRKELADLVKTAGYDDIVDGILDPHNLISSVREEGSLTPENINVVRPDNDDTITNIPDPFVRPKRPADTTNGFKDETLTKRFAF
ncbi:hypothetical protein Aperf_G00000031286 [Anoplocephala perfoliata]